MSNEGRNEENNEEREFEIIDVDLEAQHGDLVEIDGYDGYYFVEGYSIQKWVYANEQWIDVVYELTGAYDGQWLEADNDDLTFVTDAGQADEFLRAMPKPIDPGEPKIVPLADLFEQFRKNKEAENMAKENRKLTPREQSNKEAAEKKAARKKRKEYVDRALDGRLTAKDLIEVFPADKAKYERRIARYDRFLAKVSDGGGI
ncbi:hypothetical protein CN978_30095 [Priestia megaterium]|uniref:hypothetical protein n=1 Tax=Priestia megaterium TaxID=1404 RepID=UPI000BFBA717|nr:hypothetical protein [Priestia megaterium]PGN53955.1 hypothetical protein CN978_30095 [Priestia megaterium]